MREIILVSYLFFKAANALPTILQFQQGSICGEYKNGLRVIIDCSQQYEARNSTRSIRSPAWPELLWTLSYRCY